MSQTISAADYSTLQAARLVIDRILEGAALPAAPSADLDAIDIIQHTPRAKVSRKDRRRQMVTELAAMLRDNTLITMYYA